MRYFIVDAFTPEPFKGNPAAVVVLERDIPTDQMQRIAVEFNLAETAFLAPQSENRWHLRWFTPKIEIDLCGHATLASAFVIWRQLQAPRQTQVFTTLSGELTATPIGDNIELNFPAVTVNSATIDPDLIAALNLTPSFVGRTEHDVLLQLDKSDTVKNYQADFAAIAGLPSRGLIITAPGNGEIDFVSRFFAPNIGINEDPVTGAVHCALATYWANKLDKTEFRARQLSARGGELEVALADKRVLLRGQAVCTMHGELLV